MTTHRLKTDPVPFAAVLAGDKTYEIRFNDRYFKVGDTLELLETKFTWEEMRNGKPLITTGRSVHRIVSHIQDGYGLMPGWVVLSFGD